MSTQQRHILSVLVENKVWFLAAVSTLSLFPLAQPKTKHFPV